MNRNGTTKRSDSQNLDAEEEDEFLEKGRVLAHWIQLYKVNVQVRKFMYCLGLV